MLNLDIVRADIEQWIINFVEVPHPSLGGWAPCPYARQARLNKEFDVKLGLAPMHDLIALSKTGLGSKSVVIIAYDPILHAHKDFSSALNVANEQFLLPNNLLALEDHPADPEIVNGVAMNQGTYALALVQGLSDLNAKAELVAKKGFYKDWPEEYLTTLFQHREDPRK